MSITLRNTKITDLDVKFVKEYMKIDVSDFDIEINLLIEASISYIETLLNKKIDELDYIPTELTVASLYLINHWFNTKNPIGGKIKVSEEVAHTITGLIRPHYEYLSYDDFKKVDDNTDGN